jgi:hypothetical protein
VRFVIMKRLNAVRHPARTDSNIRRQPCRIAAAG